MRKSLKLLVGSVVAVTLTACGANDAGDAPSPEPQAEASTSASAPETSAPATTTTTSSAPAETTEATTNPTITPPPGDYTIGGVSAFEMIEQARQALDQPDVKVVYLQWGASHTCQVPVKGGTTAEVTIDDGHATWLYCDNEGVVYVHPSLATVGPATEAGSRFFAARTMAYAVGYGEPATSCVGGFVAAANMELTDAGMQEILTAMTTFGVAERFLGAQYGVEVYRDHEPISTCTELPKDGAVPAS